LAHVLDKYRWVVCQGAEGPDIVQDARGYNNSHWFPLFAVDYEHPEHFDLQAAQPYFTALLKGAYRVDYGVTPDDIAAHHFQLWRPPDRQWREVSLAFAAGYTTHLLADYFCHRPAQVWWDKRPEMADACDKGTSVRSYGQLQIVFADMLWQRYLAEYGVEPDAAESFRAHVDDYHVDNGALPYCALVCSLASYEGWPERVRELVDVAQFDACAAPFVVGEGSLGGVVQSDHEQSLAILREAGLGLDEAIALSDELTGWREVYRQVVDMIVRVWQAAAPEVGLQKVDDTDLVSARPGPSQLPELLPLDNQPGAQLSLALHGASALKTWHARDGRMGAFRRWSEEPRARLDPGMAIVGGQSMIALLTHPPYHGLVGFVMGEYLLQLPDTDRPLSLRGFTSLFANTTDSDGVVMRVAVESAYGEQTELLRREVTEQAWQPFDLDLSPYRGQVIRLRFITDAGLRGNTVRDNAAWGAPTVVVAGTPQGG